MADNKQEPLKQTPANIPDLCREFNALYRRLKKGRSLDLAESYQNRSWDKLYEGDVDKLENAMRFAFQFLQSAAGESAESREKLVEILAKGAGFKSKSAVLYAGMSLVCAHDFLTNDQKGALIDILASGVSSYPADTMSGAALCLQELSPQIDSAHAQALIAIIVEGAERDYEEAARQAETLRDNPHIEDSILQPLESALQTTGEDDKPSLCPGLS